MTETTRELAMMVLALEYGHKGCEKGWNLEKTKYEFMKVLHPENEGAD